MDELQINPVTCADRSGRDVAEGVARNKQILSSSVYRFDVVLG